MGLKCNMKFSYRARTKQGRLQSGEIEASSRKGALDVLEKNGLYITFLQEEKKGLFNKKLVWGRDISSRDLVVFTRQLSTMLKSAISPLEALRAQVTQAASASFRQKILKMAETIETGGTLSQAFALYPKVFGVFYVSIIKSGEATGKVADSMLYLADHLETEYNFNQKIIAALVYPSFVVAVFLGSGLVILLFVIPKLSEILKNFSGNLPWMTKILIKVADFVGHGGWVVAPIILVPLIIAPIFVRRSQEAKSFYHRYSLKIPLVGDLFKKIYISRFAENLSILISSGLPITQAIKITGEIIANSSYKKAIKETEEKVSRGEKISAVLSGYPDLFPAFVIQMISTGEETGRVDQTLMDMVKFYRGDIERAIERLTTLLEPAMILVLGIGIGILAFAVFIPLFQMGMNPSAGM